MIETTETTKIIPVSADVDKIIKRLPASTMEQKVYRAKVIFLGVNKTDKHYNPRKDWSVNGNNYTVLDGEIAYLPEEAKNSLLDAIEIRKVPTPAQEKYGIDGARREKYKSDKVPRFNLEIYEVYKQAIVDGEKVFVSETEQIKAKDRDETIKVILAEKEKQMRADLEDEFKSKLDAQIASLNAKLEPAIDEDELSELESAIEQTRNMEQ